MPYRLTLILEWLQKTATIVIENESIAACSPQYISTIAAILWSINESNLHYNMKELITRNFFDSIYQFNFLAISNVALKYALDSLLCSLCYIKPELFPLMLQKMGVEIPSMPMDQSPSISDDSKDSESMTDDTKQSFRCNADWYDRFVSSELNADLSTEQLETIALVSRSPTAIQQLLDSGLPKFLNFTILQFCSLKFEDASLTTKLDKVTAILKFFASVSEERIMRDWLGSSDGSSFFLPLLQFLCKRGLNTKLKLHSETIAHLEEVCVQFLSKVCLCHPNNQTLLAKVLCEVIGQQSSGISGFMRRLILQLLLENEKVPVTIRASETLYKNLKAHHINLPFHPAYKQTHDRAFLYLGTNVTLNDILEQYVSFSANLKSDPNINKKEMNNKTESIKNWWSMAVDSDISMAAGVTAKDKRAKDAKNQIVSTPQSKKKRYASNEGPNNIDQLEGKIIKCDSLPDEILPFGLTLAQVLQLIRERGISNDWPSLHLTVHQSKGDFN